LSPQNSTYYENSVFINFTVRAFDSIDLVGHSLDEGPVERITDLIKIKEESGALSNGIVFRYVTYMGNLYLSDVKNGNHSIIIYEGRMYNGYLIQGYAFSYFFVNSTPPTISNLSIENKTYHQGGIFPLNFTVDEPTSWIGYSLDNEANITLTGNTTLEVHPGFHTLVIYANDTADNMGASDTVEFTLQPNLPTPTSSPSPTQQPTLEPSPIASHLIDYTPTWMLLITLTLTIIIGVAAYFYFKKRRR
jgi:hypothetical protein